MNAQSTSPSTIVKVPTGHPGLDQILRGGMPIGRTTLVSGTAGSGKTIFALQFLIGGIRDHDEAAVFVTCEETPDSIRENAASLGFAIVGHEQERKWTFVDATYDPGVEEEVVGAFDFAALIARIEHAVRTTGATRVAIDSLGALMTRYEDAYTVRREMLRVSNALRTLGVTSILTNERGVEHGEIGRFGVEEYVCDNVLILRNTLDEESRRRTLEVLKMRGVDHLTGEFPVTILPNQGLVVITLEGSALNAESSTVRIHSGLEALDEMCNGGMFRDSVSLVSGATGTGKTLLVTEFIDGGASQGERSLIFSFEESRFQLFRNAAGWGRDFETLEASGALRVEAIYPEMRSLEDHLVAIMNAVDEYQPTRIAIDSLSALERISTERSFREFLIGLTSFIKHRQIAALMTATARTLLGGESLTEAHISTLTDMIMLLRYVEMGGEIRRGFAVLKLRGSTHDKRIHEFTVDGTGMNLRGPFRGVTGILSGSPQSVAEASPDLEIVAQMFDPDGGPTS
ncbi:MAG: circadian clock protein KaiC [Pimelobacter sp.]|nr:circadian clock protein KaiC [Pimelobacter sp.]